MIKALKKYFWNILISLDQLLNTLLFGSPDETISSRVGKMVYQYDSKCKLAHWLCFVLNWIDKDHCKKVIEEDEGKNNIHFK